MMIFGRPVSDYLFIFALWLGGVFYTAVAIGYPAEARAVPLLVGIPLIILTTIDLIAMTNTNLGLWLRRLDPGAAPRQGDEDDKEPAHKHAAALGALFGFLVLFVLVGAIAATAVYVALSMRLLGGYKFLTAALTGAIVAAACYGAFELLLKIDLYKGIFVTES